MKEKPLSPKKGKNKHKEDFLSKFSEALFAEVKPILMRADIFKNRENNEEFRDYLFFGKNRKPKPYSNWNKLSERERFAIELFYKLISLRDAVESLEIFEILPYCLSKKFNFTQKGNIFKGCPRQLYKCALRS